VKKFPQKFFLKICLYFSANFPPATAESAETPEPVKTWANVRSREIFSKKFFPKFLEDDEDDEDALNLRL
jgi:hypothetical protein